MSDSGIHMPVIESLILASPEPLAARKISEVVDHVSPGEVDVIVEELNRKYRDNDLSFRIRRIAGGYQMYIIEDYARYVEDLLIRRRNVRLTRAALETLAIIAYRQPVTKTDIEMIRGVASDSVIHTLLERKLITLAGRADTVGRPLLYKTTDEFLKFFNLNSLNDLPRMEEIEELLASSEAASQQNLPLNGALNVLNATENDRPDDDEEGDDTPDEKESPEPDARRMTAVTAETSIGSLEDEKPKQENVPVPSDDGIKDAENAEVNEKKLQQVETGEEN